MAYSNDTNLGCDDSVSTFVVIIFQTEINRALLIVTLFIIRSSSQLTRLNL